MAGCCGPAAALTDCRSATRFIGMLAGEETSAAAFGTKDNPVTLHPR